MSKKIIDIDGFIGSGGYSSQYVKNALREAGDNDVEVHINSLGGDVAHAIAIKDALQAHGKITAVYSGMSASSATIISLGCNTIKMTKDSFYLVHKPFMYVDAWGAMNEDELKQLIEKLDATLESAQKVTLQIARMYSEKTGKTMKEMLDLMKKSTWINAEEAREFGFVDEITEPVKVTNYLEDMKLVAMIKANDLPLPGRSPAAAAETEDIAARIEKAGDTFLQKLMKIFSNHNKSNTEMSKPNLYALLCVVLAVEAIEITDEGAFLNKEQLDKLEAEMKKLQDAKAAVESTLATATTAKETAENALSGVTNALDELGETVKAADTPAKKVEAVRTKLAEKPGAGATLIQTKGDKTRKAIEGADPVTNYAKGLV